MSISFISTFTKYFFSLFAFKVTFSRKKFQTLGLLKQSYWLHIIEAQLFSKSYQWRWLFHQRGLGTTKKNFSTPPIISLASLDMLFWRKWFEIDPHKPPKCIWSYHEHMINTRWPKWSMSQNSRFQAILT